MKGPSAFLAFDLGAESGRAVLGRLQNDRIFLQEIHRFPNRPVKLGDSLHWDVLRLWEQMKHGLALAVREAGDSLISLGVDTWGVDFVLLDIDDNLISNPFHYRDRRTEGILETVSNDISYAQIYQQTGIQIMAINSLYQLVSMAKSKSPQMASASTFLNMPDLFNFWFSGLKASEYTITTTTQCYNPITNQWAWDLLKRLEIPTYILSQAYDLTNEGGYGGKICLLKNILVLWLLQECSREWVRNGQVYSYDDLTQIAASALPFKAYVNPTDPGFLMPGDMIIRIQAFCRATRQPVPQTQAEIVRCILESLALEYRHVVEQISSLSGFPPPVIHITGGGARNELLNQFTANATGLKVITGPVEVTAIGNILVQSITAGQVDSLAEGRALVRRSVETRESDPIDAPYGNKPTNVIPN